MTEHVVLGAFLVFVALQVGFVGYLVYKVVRKNDPLEGMIAATYLQARKFLEQQSQSRQDRRDIEVGLDRYSTVTLFARFLGWSTSQPRRTATW
jgi:hypothetical protein